VKEGNGECPYDDIENGDEDNQKVLSCYDSKLLTFLQAS
jgi:hypothetical protein